VILVDSSVWIDYFRRLRTPETERLDALLGADEVAIGDLMLTEVLQGFTRGGEFDTALRLMSAIPVIDIVGKDITIQAAENFRHLRTHGVTIRKTIDTLIATRCIEDDYALLFSDRDFEPFVEHLGLRRALAPIH
jgi:predicted nucleic acid-binding protein